MIFDNSYHFFCLKISSISIFDPAGARSCVGDAQDRKRKLKIILCSMTKYSTFLLYGSFNINMMPSLLASSS
jgi:hypothetical protein